MFGVGSAGDRPLPEIIDYAVTAENKGFNSIWLADHYCFRELIVCMTAVGMSTKRLVVASGTANPYTRHPATYAMSLATLRESIGDRLVFGIGAALAPQERLLGKRLTKNITMLKESIQITRGLLGGEEVNQAGEAFNVKELKMDFGRPVPIYLGAIGPRLIELAGQRCDGLCISAGASVNYVREAITRFREAAVRAGRDPDRLKVASYVLLSVSEDSAASKDCLKQWVANCIAEPFFQPVLTASRVKESDIQAVNESIRNEGFAEGSKKLPAYLVDEFAAAGTPSQCRDKIEEFMKTGLDEIVLLPMGPNPTRAISDMADQLKRHFQNHR